MVSTRPVFFLDIDGCLSPLAGDHLGPLPDVWPAWNELPGVSLGPVYVAPGLIDRLNALPVDILWCSTWEELVDGKGGLNEALGWEGTPWLRLPTGRGGPWFKRQAIQGWLEEHGARPFIWADDDPRLSSSGRPWARGLLVQTLLIRPEKKIGLTPKHLDQMERWVAGVGAPQRPTQLS